MTDRQSESDDIGGEFDSKRGHQTEMRWRPWKPGTDSQR